MRKVEKIFMKDFESKREIAKLNSQRIRERERKIRVVKMGILIMLLALIIMYFLLRIVFETGYFTVSLDPEFAKTSGLIMYEKLDEKLERKILKATRVDFMDNISVKWLPENLNKIGEGSHNGKNYLAYSFYVENQGSESINYWYEIFIDDVIKNVDKAIRVIVYRNDEKTTYAKANEATGEPEPETEKFYSSSSVVLKNRAQFNPGDIDKFTIVIYLEGDDPDCVDSLIGGEMKMHMDITEEHI